MKKILSVLLIALLAMTMVFANGASETAEAGGKTEIKLFSLQFGQEPSHIQVLVDQYMEKNPDVTITVEEYPWDSYWQNLEVRFGAKEPGFDVVVMDIPMLANYAERGYIMPLDNYISKDLLAEKVAETCIPAVTYNGKVYAAPLQSSDQYLFINTAMAEEAGIEFENVVTKDTDVTAEFTEKWNASALTWDQVVEYAKKMTKDTDGDGIVDVYGLHLDQAGRIYQLQPLGGSRGGKIVSPDGKTIEGYFDQPVWLDAIQFYYDLFNTYKVEDPGSFMPGVDVTNNFINGKYAMLVGGGWNIKRFSDAGLDVMIAPHPYFADGELKTPTGSWVLGVSSKAPEAKLDAIMDFVNWWSLSDEGAQAWYDANGELPVNKFVLDQLFTADKYDVFPLSAQRLGAYQVLNTAEARPVTPYFNFISEGFDNAFTNAAKGTEPEKAWKDGIAEINKKIQRVQ